MKKHSRLYEWFWYRPVFRNLRPRLMTMILALVLPLSLVSVALSVVSIVRSTETGRQMAENGFSFYLSQIALREELGDLDIRRDFPETLARQVTPLYWNAWESAPYKGHGGNVYLTQDGEQAFLAKEDGSWETVSASFGDLGSGSEDSFLWKQEGAPFQVLVTFPYNFALRNVPAWYWIALGISLATILVIPLLFGRLNADILKPMKTMEQALDAFGGEPDTRIRIPGKEVSDDYLHLFEEFNRMAAEVQASHEKDIKLLETERDNLRLQVNPHLLLNSYNTIYALAESKNYSVIQDYTLRKKKNKKKVLRKGQDQVTLRQELEFVDNFIRIQRIRFPGRFSYVYQAEEECMEARIPPLLIENFVENAIKYALDPRAPIEIVVSVHREKSAAGKESLHISVIDTGSGIRPEILEKLEKREPYVDEAGQKHIGIWNCLRRVELFYGDEGEIHFTSAEGRGTQVYLIVPLILPAEHHEGEAAI